MSDYPELRKLQDIIDNQADRILDLEAALAEWKALAIQWAKDHDDALAPEQDK